MADPVYLMQCLLAAGMFVLGFLMIMEGINDDADVDI